MIKITIPGTPKAQKRHRPSARGGYYDPSSTDKKQTWLQIAKYRPKLPLTGSIELKLIFYMPRPKSHYRTGKYSHLLKEKCKDIVYHTFKSDVDNFCKFYMDLMNSGFYVDDSQVCVLQAEKKYGEPRTEIMIDEIT